MKQYKAVAGPKNFSVNKGETQSAFDAFADIMNREAKNGWEYHSMQTITVTEKPGCMFKAPIPMTHYMFIFEKDV